MESPPRYPSVAECRGALMLRARLEAGASADGGDTVPEWSRMIVGGARRGRSPRPARSQPDSQPEGRERLTGIPPKSHQSPGDRPGDRSRPDRPLRYRRRSEAKSRLLAITRKYGPDQGKRSHNPKVRVQRTHRENGAEMRTLVAEAGSPPGPRRQGPSSGIIAGCRTASSNPRQGPG